jgi:tol-pal system protein YbgF
VSRSCTSAGALPLRAALCAALLLALQAQAAAPVTEKDSTGIAARLERLEGMMQNEGLIDLLRQVQSLQQEVNRLRGEVDVQAHAIEQMRERERALHADMDRRLHTLETGGAAPAADATADAAGTIGAEPPLETLSGVAPDADATAGTEADSALTVETVTAPAAAAPAAGTAASGALAAAAPAITAGAAAADSTEQGDYDRGFWLLKQARHDEAITAFRNYRAAWPGGRNADNAQYWLGESYHALRQFDQALIEYERLIAEFPNSQKITHALLKSGYCLQELGRTDEARARLRDLAARYPGTTAARLAEERLRTLAAAASAP